MKDKDYVVTQENYYSLETSEHFMSFHDFMSYHAHLGVKSCEAKAEAIRRGEWKEPTTKAMLVGSYVDSAIEGTLDTFREEHKEIFLKDGKTLKSDFRLAETMLERMNKDAYFMKTLSGDKQVILTGTFLGANVKCKIDSLMFDKEHKKPIAIVDLKTTSDLHKMWRINNVGWATVPEYWFYTGQLAWYQKIVEQNYGVKVPCYLSFVTKEEYPELSVVNIDQLELDEAWQEIEDNMPSVLAIRNGEVEPMRCEQCDYCKSTKVLKNAIGLADLIIAE